MMKYGRSSIIFISMITATMQLDGMLKNLGRVPLNHASRRLISHASSHRMTLAQKIFVGVPKSRMFHFSNEYPEPSWPAVPQKTGVGVILCKGKDNYDSKKVLDIVDNKVWTKIALYLEYCKKSSKSRPPEIMKLIVDEIERMMLADGRGIITQLVYEYISKQIKSGLTMHPELLIMVLSINKHNDPNRLLLEATIAHQIDRKSVV